MGRLLFLILLLSARLGFADQVRVLLDEGVLVPSFHFLGPAEFSTSTQKISLYDSNFKITSSNANKKWLVTISRGQRKEQFFLKGDTLLVSSLAAIQWRDQALDFKIQLKFKNNKYYLIGEMSMDRYLSGVVGHEMPGSWPKEALKAQTIASRSYAYWKMQSNRNDIYDLRPSVMDQVFQLPRWGESTSLPKNVETAITSTSDEILIEEQKKVLKAYFHSDCGGATTTPGKAWGEKSRWVTSVKDPYCKARESQWDSRWTQAKIQSRLMQEFILPTGMNLKDVIVRQQLDSPRVESVDFLFSSGVFKRLSGEQFRRLMGYDKIRSTTFQVAKRNDEWVFAGRGFGHGVGMCQHGARSMAQLGMNYRQILEHYYPQAAISGAKRHKGLLKISSAMQE